MANTKQPDLKEPGPSDNQLLDYKKANKSEQLTTGYGRPLGERTTVVTVGPRGPLLLSDFPYIEDTQRFDRERIPERVVHAKGYIVFLFLFNNNKKKSFNKLKF
jgi:catalase